MGKKKKLEKIHKKASGMCCENMAILDNLILNGESCPSRCYTLLEMAKERNIKVFNEIEKSRQILKITD